MGLLFFSQLTKRVRGIEIGSINVPMFSTEFCLGKITLAACKAAKTYIDIRECVFGSCHNIFPSWHVQRFAFQTAYLMNRQTRNREVPVEILSDRQG